MWLWKGCTWNYKERETFLASQISLINLVDRGNDVLPMDYPHILPTEAPEKTISPLSWQARRPCSTLPTPQV